MALDETLRMYPPAWIGPRRSVEPFELQRRARARRGVFVNYCSWASHHLPEVFPEPERFRPERFAPEAKAALPKGAYVPFGGGSRTCIGMRFGQLEVKAIAASILRALPARARGAGRRRLDPPDADAVAARRLPVVVRGPLRRDGRCLARTGDLHVVSVALCQLS